MAAREGQEILLRTCFRVKLAKKIQSVKTRSWHQESDRICKESENVASLQGGAPYLQIGL